MSGPGRRNHSRLLLGVRSSNVCESHPESAKIERHPAPFPRRGLLDFERQARKELGMTMAEASVKGASGVCELHLVN